MTTRRESDKNDLDPTPTAPAAGPEPGGAHVTSPGGVGAPLARLGRDAPSTRGRPKKRSRQGQGGGPKTAEGKARAALNPMKHGMYAASPTIPGESEEELQAYVAGIIESLEPHGFLEHVLAKRAALLLWRLERVPRYESATTTNAMTYTPFDPEDEDDDGDDDDEWERERLIDPTGFHYLLGTEFHLNKIMRAEGHLHRQLTQTLNQLEAIQARRAGKPTPLHRVDVTSAPQYRNTRAPNLGDVANDFLPSP